VEFHTPLTPQKGEPIIRKHYPNAFRDTQLLTHLKQKGVTHLIIAGMMTHLSVDSTVRAAYDLGFICTVIQDACATRYLEFNGTVIPAQHVQNAFLAALQPLYAEVISSRECLQRLARQAMVTS
jgi:nicotinamidase-related amidase